MVVGVGRGHHMPGGTVGIVPVDIGDRSNFARRSPPKAPRVGYNLLEQVENEG